ncbi:MAG: TolC family protein [Deltaproteobacteria bacterium]|nr:TolC family protein [Deltaproteobacteria bacterium]
MIGPLLLLALAQEIPGTRTPFDLSDPAALLVELEAVELSRLEVGGGSSLGFDEVVRSVDRHHPELLGARQRQGGAAGQLLAAEGGFDLRLDAALEHRPFGYYDSTHLIAKLEQPTPIWGAKLYAGYELGLGKIPLYDGDYETLNGGELKAGLRVPIWRDGPIDKRRAAIGKATFILDAEAAATRVALLELSLDAGEAYWKWVAAGQSYLVAVALYDLARDRDAQLASKVQRGAVPAIDRAENLRAVLTRREAVVTARRSFEQAALKLSLYARDDDGRPRVPDPKRLPLAWEPSPSLPPSELDQGLARAQSRPELARYRALQEAAAVELDFAENRVAPQIDLDVAAAKDLGTSDDANKVTTLGPAELKAGVTFSLPFQLRSERGEREAAQAKLEETRQKAQYAQEKVENQIRDLWSALNAQKELVDVATRTVRVAKAVAEGERTRFDLGSTTLFIVNLREQSAADAETKALKALADYRTALLAWQLATAITPAPGER